MSARIADAILAAGDLCHSRRACCWNSHGSCGPSQSRAASKVNACLTHLFSLPGVHVEDREEVETALDYSARGVDFADALHLAASGGCNELLTFDDKPTVKVPV